MNWATLNNTFAETGNPWNHHPVAGGTSMGQSKAVFRVTAMCLCVSAALAGATSATAGTAALDYDCDVPSDRYSSISQNTTGAMSIQGTVKMLDARSGTKLPVAGARLVSSDGKSSATLHLILNQPKAKFLDVVLTLDQRGSIKKYAVAKVSTNQETHFRFYAADGKINLEVGSEALAGDFTLNDGTEMAFCSTGQFKFAQLIFGTQ